jgi:hypothetical protein
MNNAISNFIKPSVLLILAIAVSCVHELPIPKTDSNNGGTTPPPSAKCSADTVYFANTILPLINSVCGKSGCHGAVNRNAFSLTSYTNIVNVLGSTNRLNEALLNMADVKNENPTLDYTPPSSDQLAFLQKWISQGTKNNKCSECDTTQFTYAAIISPIISTYCKGCHSGYAPAASVDLSSITSIQAEITNNPGRLLGSIQWVAPYTGTKEMPQGGSKFSDCYITQIKKWIEAGAPNN